MNSAQAWLPDLLYVDGTFLNNYAIACDDAGRVVRLVSADLVANPVCLPGRALLPGLVNGHSHAFQRVIRGRTEYRSQSSTDSFWTWRSQMYAAANRLQPADIYAASRMAFLEMALSGITSVGEFHYIHHAPDGSTYSDPNLLAKEVIRAAQDVGIRIALLRVAYARAGYQREADPQQVRFIENSAEIYLKHLEKLIGDCPNVTIGLAPHSVRAVPLEYLRTIVEFANQQRLPVHMHVAEQPAEVSACIEEYGRSPVALLETEGLLSERFTAVHAIHVTPKAITALAQSGTTVCACPTTERNLGDGVVPARDYFKAGVPISLGTDSQTQIDLLEDARELEYHLRLSNMERNVLAPDDTNETATLAQRLFDCATKKGASSIGIGSGQLAEGDAADFFTVDLDDPSIAGASPDDLLASIVFSMSRSAIRDVVVGGKRIVQNGRHALQEEIVSEFAKLQEKLW